jgi:hypothetical protein
MAPGVGRSADAARKSACATTLLKTDVVALTIATLVANPQ